MSKLIRSNASLAGLLGPAATTTLVVADPYNLEAVQGLGLATVLPGSSLPERLWPNSVVAVGGCSARDWAAYLATRNRLSWSYIPTILSTDCLSATKALVYDALGRHWGVPVKEPDSVQVSFPLLRQGGQQNLSQWCAAGVGDLMSCISAAIDRLEGSGSWDVASILKAVPASAACLCWLHDCQPTWTDAQLWRLATFLHASSKRAAATGTARFNAAGEHELYYVLRTQRPDYRPDRQRHGVIVSVGTLMSAWSYTQHTGDSALEDRLRIAYRAVGLPTSEAELTAHGIEREHLITALTELMPGSFLEKSYLAAGDALLDECYRGH